MARMFKAPVKTGPSANKKAAPASEKKQTAPQAAAKAAVEPSDAAKK